MFPKSPPPKNRPLMLLAGQSNLPCSGWRVKNGSPLVILMIPFREGKVAKAG